MKILLPSHVNAARKAIGAGDARGLSADIKWHQAHGRGEVVESEPLAGNPMPNAGNPMPGTGNRMQGAGAPGAVQTRNIVVSIDIGGSTHQQNIPYGGGKIIIGRSSNCNITILVSDVSRSHAAIEIDGDKIFLEDLRSANGTYWHGQRVGGSRIEITSDPEFTVGPATIRVVSIDGQMLHGANSTPQHPQPIPQPQQVQPAPVPGQMQAPVQAPLPPYMHRIPTDDPHSQDLDERLRELAEEYSDTLDWGDFYPIGRPELNRKDIELTRLRREMANLIQQGANPSLLPQGLTVDDLMGGGAP